MKIQATTHSGKPFLVAATLTGKKDYAAVSAERDRLYMVEVQLPDETKVWVDLVDCRTDQGAPFEAWPWPVAVEWPRTRD